MIYYIFKLFGKWRFSQKYSYSISFIYFLKSSIIYSVLQDRSNRLKNITYKNDSKKITLFHLTLYF